MGESFLVIANLRKALRGSLLFGLYMGTLLWGAGLIAGRPTMSFVEAFGVGALWYALLIHDWRR